jgi:hypothetical protein
MLFIEFNTSGIFNNYTWIDVNCCGCFRNPFTAWDAEARHREYAACSKRLQESAFAEFRVLTDKPAE